MSVENENTPVFEDDNFMIDEKKENEDNKKTLNDENISNKKERSFPRWGIILIIILVVIIIVVILILFVRSKLKGVDKDLSDSSLELESLKNKYLHLNEQYSKINRENEIYRKENEDLMNKIENLEEELDNKKNNVVNFDDKEITNPNKTQNYQEMKNKKFEISNNYIQKNIEVNDKTEDEEKTEDNENTEDEEYVNNLINN